MTTQGLRHFDDCRVAMYDPAISSRRDPTISYYGQFPVLDGPALGEISKLMVVQNLFSFPKEKTSHYSTPPPTSPPASPLSSSAQWGKD